ncbi:hypothetical protein M885DRAFT_510274 [Pelagophyceae sp. CCMP2097]|nr:hypothetical protein M885DRAFT_510274 [Pelagophyceae sp. CCMP2097]
MSLCKRDPFADRKGLFEHLTPRNLFFSSLHALAFTAAPIVAACTPPPGEDFDDDDDIVDWERVAIEMQTVKPKAALAFARVVGCTSLKRALEAACIRCFSRKTAARLIKEPSKSAARKFARLEKSYLARPRIAARMLRTAAYANVCTYAANFLVEEALFVAQYVLAKRREPRNVKKHRAALRKQTRATLHGYAVAYALATLGMGLGTLIRPGWGTTLGGAFGDLAGILLL